MKIIKDCLQRFSHITKAVLSVCLLGLLPVFTVAQVAITLQLDGLTYRLQFADEFKGKSLNTKKWLYRTDSKHWSTQLPANVVVKEGILHLDLKKENAGDKQYTGAGVISAKRFHFGYYETRMKVPPGAGWHTSFWLQGYDGMGGTGTGKTTIEIDIIENDSKNPEKYGINLHRWQGEHKSTVKDITTPAMDEDFHTLACTYTPEYMKFYFDRKEVRTIDLKPLNFPLGSLNIWLTSIASHLGNTTVVDDTQLPSSAQFDYVRFYKLVQ